MDNTARDHRLRVLFPSGCRNAGTWHADAPFDTVERPIVLPDTGTWAEPWPETQACRSFASVCDDGRGLAVLVKGIPEIACLDDEERTLALTLLRCTRRSIGEDYAESGAQCLGTHTFEYALVPFSGSRDAVVPAREAQEFLTPLRAMLFRGGLEGALPTEHGFLTVDTPEPAGTVRLSALKPSEDGAACILRVSNPTERETRVRVAPGSWCAGATQARLDETPTQEPVEHGNDGVVTVPLRQRRSPPSASPATPDGASPVPRPPPP